MIESGERPMPIWVSGDIHQWVLDTKYCDAVDPEYHTLTSEEVLKANNEINECERKTNTTATIVKYANLQKMVSSPAYRTTTTVGQQKVYA
ncbi:hypothetical protein ACTOVL_05900 [Arcanobacterium canis]